MTDRTPAPRGRKYRKELHALWTVVLLGCLSLVTGEVRADCTLTSTGKTPLTDMGPSLYYKDPAWIGGLYPNLSNQPTAAHLAAATAAASFIKPLDTSGHEDPVNGRVVLLSIGISNTSNEFAVPPKPTTPPPDARLPIIDRAYTFLERENADPSKNPKLVVINGAQGGKDIVEWSHDLSDPADPDPDPEHYWAIIDSRLAAAGLSPAQVQVVWIKQAHAGVTSFPSFPTTNGSDSIAFFQHRMEQLVRNVKYLYPNAKLAFVSSRTRAYSDPSTPGAGSREPYTYQAGYAVRSLIEQQANYGAQPGSPLYYGDPSPAVNDGVSPVVLWGPYLWIDGLVARSDGMTWACNNINPFQDTTYSFASALASDTRAWTGTGSIEADHDYKHPGGGGIRKVADQLLAFFKTQPLTTPWFLDPNKVLAPSSVTVSSGGVTSGAAPLTVHFSATNVDPANQSPKIIQYAWSFDDGTSRLSDLYRWNLVNGGPPAGSFAAVEASHDPSSQSPQKTFYVPGTHRVRMTATDSLGNTLTKEITIQVTSPSPAAPTVSLVSPEVGAAITGDVAMRATASDPDGTVTGVDFYADNVLIGAGVPAGGGRYDLVWTPSTGGAHDVRAVATDQSGLTKSSWTATITETLPNHPPAVAITSPVAGAIFDANADVVLEAVASDADGSVDFVDFYADGTWLGMGASLGGSTYTLTWSSAPAGDHELTAIAMDDLGLSASSTPIAIQVKPSIPPTVALVSPAEGAAFVTPGAVLMAASASDADGLVNEVAFYADGARLGAGVDSGGSTYTYAWLGAALGGHSIVAIAADNQGLMTMSTPASITMSSPAPALRCTTIAETTALRASLRQAMLCNRNVLLYGPASCSVSAPPACAGTLVSDAVALTWGPNNPPAAAVNSTTTGVKKPFDCQTEIVKSATTYAGDKPYYLAQGYTPLQADALLAAAFDTITTKCAGVAVAKDASGVVLPQVAPACNGFVGALGHVVDPAGLTACLRTSLEGMIRVVGNYRAPVVSMTGPASGSAFTQPVSILLSATASDADGAVGQVGFYADGVLLGVGSGSGGSYTFLWQAAPAGAHAVHALATDTDTLVTASAPFAVNVYR